MASVGLIRIVGAGVERDCRAAEMDRVLHLPGGCRRALAPADDRRQQRLRAAPPRLPEVPHQSVVLPPRHHRIRRHQDR